MTDHGTLSPEFLGTRGASSRWPRPSPNMSTICSALPTPVVRDRESLAKVTRGAGSSARGNARQQPLAVAVAGRAGERLFRTPAAGDGKWRDTPATVARRAASGKQLSLHGDVIARALLPTASTRDWKDSPGMGKVRPDGRSRVDQLARVVFDRAETPKGGGQLNPDWVEWLMGYGVGWTDPAREPAPFAGWHEEPAELPRVVAQPVLRRQRLTALGNAVVPQCAAVAFARLINLLADMEDQP